jgi:hypothetical protein
MPFSAGVMATDTLDACKAAALAAGGGFAGVTYHKAAFARSSPSNAAYLLRIRFV